MDTLPFSPVCPSTPPTDGGVNTLPRPRGGLVGTGPSCAVPLDGAAAPGGLWAVPGFAATEAGAVPGLGAFGVVPAGGVLPAAEAAPAVLPRAAPPAPPPAGGGEGGGEFGPGDAEPLLGRLLLRLPEEGVFPPPVRLAATVCITVRAAWFAIMVGRAIKPCPRGLPVWAGFSPIRQTISSFFLPPRTMAVTKISQGKIPRPLGTVLMVERSSFRKMTFISIITHILPNILHHPLKISSVFLLLPMPKARGANTTKITVTTYRSPISKKNFITWKMRISPMSPSR